MRWQSKDEQGDVVLGWAGTEVERHGAAWLCQNQQELIYWGIQVLWGPSGDFQPSSRGTWLGPDTGSWCWALCCTHTMVSMLGAVCAPCWTCTMIHVYHDGMCTVLAALCVPAHCWMYTEVYVPSAAGSLCHTPLILYVCCAGHALCWPCHVCNLLQAVSAWCRGSMWRDSKPLWILVQSLLAKTPCENHEQQLTLWRVSHRTVRITAEGRLVFYNDYVEMEITVKPNNSSGACNENERDNSLPGLIQISKHIFTWEGSQTIPLREASSGRGEKKSSTAH